MNAPQLISLEHRVQNGVVFSIQQGGLSFFLKERSLRFNRYAKQSPKDTPPKVRSLRAIFVYGDSQVLGLLVFQVPLPLRNFHIL